MVTLVFHGHSHQDCVTVRLWPSHTPQNGLVLPGVW